MNWYCVHTKPTRETQAVEQLSAYLGLQTFFPRIRRSKIYRRKLRKMEEPLFPRYLFCRCDLNRDYRAVRYARDVIDVLSFGSRPAVVSDALIDDLKAWTGSSEVIVEAPIFAAGDKVEITGGPMRGFQAVIMNKHTEGERVAVLLSILGCDAQLTINRCQLAKAG
ncbi:MAG TPA: transcription termination/antitermination NusG family protein [Opitutaceae bacterium]|nr:transcription termination/antitermination NusG family protein [Opitutaceae bacterium]